MLNRFLVLYLIFISSLFSSEIHSTYNISFGIFNKIAKATAIFKKDRDSYSISMKVKSKGMAKFITNNRRENYLSRGFIKDGILIPTFYQKTKSTDRKSTQKDYHFDYDKKIITQNRTDIKKGKTTNSTTQLDYFATNDILSLFFNLPLLVDSDSKQKYKFKAIGAMKEGGELSVEIPVGKGLKSIKKLIGSDSGEFLLVTLNQKIFGSDKGELLINLDSDNLCKKAILKDVIFFGDIVGKMTTKYKK